MKKKPARTRKTTARKARPIPIHFDLSALLIRDPGAIKPRPLSEVETVLLKAQVHCDAAEGQVRRAALQQELESFAAQLAADIAKAERKKKGRAK